MKNYLNNKVTGESIVIDKVDIVSNTIQYSIINASGIKVSSKLPHTFSTIKLGDYFSTPTNYETLIFETLKTELILPDFIVEADSQNWLSPTKSMRFYASHENVAEGFKEQNGLATIFNNVLADAVIDTAIVNITDSVNEILYANSISEENIDVNYYLKTITDENGLIIYNNEAGIIDVEYKLV